MSNIIIYIFLIVLFLILSAFFSGMEAAIFSISRFRIKSLLFENAKDAITLNKLKENSGKTLASILLANLLVNIGASSVGAVILIHIISQYKTNTSLFFVIELIIMTSLLLVFGEITPKVIALSNAEFFALKFAGTINFISHLFNPISSLLESFTKGITSFSVSRSNQVIKNEEIKVMLTEAKKFKVLNESEEKFSYQILKFGKKKVSEIMTPRQKVVGVNIDVGIDEAKRVITSSKHSRICVFTRRRDAVGILYGKDLFISQFDKTTKPSITDLMREPYIVPETKQIDNLLGEFRKKGVHIGVVVDEFGNFSGIVTLEDILESLFGEIIDEYDELSDLPYKKFSPGVYLFDGDITIGEISQILNIEPFGEEGERLSAVILEHFKKFPREEDKFQIGNYEIIITKISGHIIKKVLIKKL